MLETEQAAVAAGLVSPHRVIRSGLLAEDFEYSHLGQLWSAVVELSRDAGDRPLDLLQVADRAGLDVLQVATVAEATATGENLNWYARQVKSSRTERETRAILEKALATAAGAGTGLLETVKADLGRIEVPAEKAGTDAKEGMLQTVNAIERAYESPGERLGGVPTYLDRIDNVLGSLHRGALSLVGGRPSVGKTSFIQTVARLAAQAGQRVVYASLEDSQRSFWIRLLAQQSGIPGNRLSAGRVESGEWERVSGAASTIADSHIEVTDRIPPNHLRLISWLERAGQDADLICLDYIQLVRSTNRGNRNEQLTEISNDLAGMVRSLDCACLVGSQLSRDADRNKPGLHHLRDCGALEADADCVLILDDMRWCGGRPKDNGDHLPVTLCRIAKNKHGQTGNVVLEWVPELTMFRSADEELMERYRRCAS